MKHIKEWQGFDEPGTPSIGVVPKEERLYNFIAIYI